MASFYPQYPSSSLLPRSAPPKAQEERRRNGAIKKDPHEENLTFQDLKSIEKERRELLLRVSLNMSIAFLDFYIVIICPTNM